jgi:hypothetical protein
MCRGHRNSKLLDWSQWCCPLLHTSTQSTEAWIHIFTWKVVCIVTPGTAQLNRRARRSLTGRMSGTYVAGLASSCTAHAPAQPPVYMLLTLLLRPLLLPLLIPLVSRFEAGVSTGWGKLDLKLMQETTFNDIAVRLGAHYVFTHDGNCEHVMVVSDIRYQVLPLTARTFTSLHWCDGRVLLSRAYPDTYPWCCMCRLYNPSVDPWKRTSYPLQCFQQKMDKRLCAACGSFAAEYVLGVCVLGGGECAHIVCCHCCRHSRALLRCVAAASFASVINWRTRIQCCSACTAIILYTTLLRASCCTTISKYCRTFMSNVTKWWLVLSFSNDVAAKTARIQSTSQGVRWVGRPAHKPQCTHTAPYQIIVQRG